MKKNIYKIILFIAVGLFLNGCENDITKSLYEEYPGGKLPQPVLGSIAPAEYAVAGVDAIEITGENFSTVKENNFVYFGSARATVLEASTTKLVVRAPNNPADTLMVKVAVLGAELYSQMKQYKLLPAAEQKYKEANRRPYGITVDRDNNLYASVTLSGAAAGILKITPDGTISTFAPPGSGETYLTNIKMGPNGFIYALRLNARALFEVQPGVGSKSWVSLVSGSQIMDFDFDKDGYVWAGGKNAKDSLYRITLADKKVKGFSFKGDVRAIKVFDNSLYVAALRDNQEKIFRIPLNAGTLGAEEEYFNISAQYPDRVTTSMLISKAGRIFIGSNSKNDALTELGTTNAFPILQINPDKTIEIMFTSVVPDLIFAGPVYQMTWGTDDYFYFIRQEIKTGTGDTEKIFQSQEIIKITARELSAPYYGRGDL